MSEQITCVECGALEPNDWMESMQQELIKHSMCFTCNFWREKFELIAKPSTEGTPIRVNGVHYFIEPDRERGFKGFGGAKFIIKLRGREEPIISHNVWCQGKIPERWRDRLPDNAEFLHDTEPYGGTFAHPTNINGEAIQA